jgi:hypothetical protein
MTDRDPLEWLIGIIGMRRATSVMHLYWLD